MSEPLGPEHPEDPSNYFWMSWIWDQYLPEDETLKIATKKRRNEETKMRQKRFPIVNPGESGQKCGFGV